jgi:hypothetical protein
MGSKQAKERTNKKILAAYVEKRRHREFWIGKKSITSNSHRAHSLTIISLLRSAAVVWLQPCSQPHSIEPATEWVKSRAIENRLFFLFSNYAHSFVKHWQRNFPEGRKKRPLAQICQCECIYIKSEWKQSRAARKAFVWYYTWHRSVLISKNCATYLNMIRNFTIFEVFLKNCNIKFNKNKMCLVFF